MARGWAAGSAEVQGESAQYVVLRIENRRRPARSQAMSECKLAVVFPQRIGCDVFHDDRFPAVRGRPARAGAGADRLPFNCARVTFRKAGSRSVPHTLSAGIEQKDRTEHVAA